MAEDLIRDIIDGVRTRLQDELETQLRTVSERHQQALTAERQRVEAEADERCARSLESVRAELDTLKIENEAHPTAAVAAMRREMETLAEEQAAHLRRELEHAVAHERQLARTDLEAERQSAAAQLEEARLAFEAERGQWQSSPAAMPLAAGPLSEHADFLVSGLREIGAAASVSDSLAAIARAAAAGAPRAALFVAHGANGAQLDEWVVAGLPSMAASSTDVNNPSSGLITQAFTTRQAVQNGGSACAVPLMLDGTPVGVLYGESGGNGECHPAWRASLEAVAHFGAAHLGCLTALRTAQARAWLARRGARSADNAAGAERERVEVAEENNAAVASARRYARLLVSEIKLYNEAAVQAGRSQRDLLERLQPEIDRARMLYEERVSASIAGRTQYFQQELVQTLAGGDPSLLG